MSSPPSSSFPAAAVLLPAPTDGAAKEPFFDEGEEEEEEASAAADERSRQRQRRNNIVAPVEIRKMYWILRTLTRKSFFVTNQFWENHQKYLNCKFRDSGVLWQFFCKSQAPPNYARWIRSNWFLRSIWGQNSLKLFAFLSFLGLFGT